MIENEQTKQTKTCTCNKSSWEEKDGLCEEELREIYRNATAGRESIDILCPLSEDSDFRELLGRQKNKFNEFIACIEERAKQQGVDIKSISLFAKGMMQMSAMMNTLLDKSSSKLASVLLQGLQMGEISIMKIVNKLNEEEKSCPLANDMIAFLQQCTKELKAFL